MGGGRRRRTAPLEPHVSRRPSSSSPPLAALPLELLLPACTHAAPQRGGTGHRPASQRARPGACLGARAVSTGVHPGEGGGKKPLTCPSLCPPPGPTNAQAGHRDAQKASWRGTRASRMHCREGARGEGQGGARAPHQKEMWRAPPSTTSPSGARGRLPSAARPPEGAYGHGNASRGQLWTRCTSAPGLVAVPGRSWGPFGGPRADER